MAYDYVKQSCWGNGRISEIGEAAQVQSQSHKSSSFSQSGISSALNQPIPGKVFRELFTFTLLQHSKELLQTNTEVN